MVTIDFCGSVWRASLFAAYVAAGMAGAMGSARAVIQIYLVDGSGRIGWVNGSLPPASSAQTPANVFTTTGNMADIAFNTANSLWGISNESGGAVLYNMATLTQAYWNTTASVSGINVTYGGSTNSAIDYNALTFSPANSSSNSGTLYATTIGSGGSPSTATSTLYRINAGTGAATLIGTYGAGIVSSGDLSFAGWNSGSPGALYASVTVGNSSVSQLATVNLSTGAATVIGAFTPGTGGAFQGLANSATNNGGLFSIDSQSVYSVNTTTGAGTVLFNYTAGQVTSARGAASLGEAIPEPASLALLCTGLAGLAFARRWRRRLHAAPG